MSDEKTTVETTVRPGRNGGTLLAGGKKGHRGAGGRPPDAFKERMAKLVERKQVNKYLQRCLDGEFGPKFFLSALAHATDRAHGRATQSVEAKVTGKVLVVRSIDELDDGNG